MDESLIEEWNLSKREIPYDVRCELRQPHYVVSERNDSDAVSQGETANGRYVGSFEAHPMDKVSRYNWIGDMHRFDGVKAVSPNIGRHVSHYSVALEYKDTELAKSIINDMATQMMWIAYPDECYDLYYKTQDQ